MPIDFCVLHYVNWSLPKECLAAAFYCSLFCKSMHFRKIQYLFSLLVNKSQCTFAITAPSFRINPKNWTHANTVQWFLTSRRGFMLVLFLVQTQKGDFQCMEWWIKTIGCISERYVPKCACTCWKNFYECITRKCRSSASNLVIDKKQWLYKLQILTKGYLHMLRKALWMYYKQK